MVESFEKKLTLDNGQIEVVIRSKEDSARVQQLLHQLSSWSKTVTDRLTSKTSDGLVVVKVADIVYLDVLDKELIIYLHQGTAVMTSQTLATFLKKIANPDFVQVSKHAAVNINHLKALENSFSGSMLAKLAGKQQTMVSRRYVKALKQALGL